MITAPLSRTVPSKNGATMVYSEVNGVAATQLELTKTTFARQSPTRSTCGKTIPKMLQVKLCAHVPQRVARDKCTISAEGCAGEVQNALSPALRALDTHDLRRELRRTNPKRTLTCISRPRHARSLQMVAPDKSKTHSHLHFAPSTRTISAEGCAGPGQNALSPAFPALDTHDLC